VVVSSACWCRNRSTPRQRIEAGPVIAAFGAGDALVGEHRHDRPAQALGDLVEVPTLVLGGLPVSGGDPDVEGDA
jgi:ribosomal protein L35AE/L33A